MPIDIVGTLTPQKYPEVAIVGRCKDCKYWGAATDTHPMRRCQAVADQGVPALVELSGDYGYGATLETGAQFGCVLFVAKEPA